MTTGQGWDTITAMEQPTRQLSNSEIGARLGISPSFASYLRNGQRQPSMTTLKAIVREFGADLGELVDAMAEAQNGDADNWVVLISVLTRVPDEKATAAG